MKSCVPLVVFVTLNDVTAAVWPRLIDVLPGWSRTTVKLTLRSTTKLAVDELVVCGDPLTVYVTVAVLLMVVPAAVPVDCAWAVPMLATAATLDSSSNRTLLPIIVCYSKKGEILLIAQSLEDGLKR